jgi:starch-binding outer membrane protein SusE/F
MKNKFKLLIFSFLLISISSCENDKDPIAFANGFELRKDATIVSPTTLLEVNNTDVFGKYNWEESNNGIETVSTYKLVIFDHDNDVDLKNPVEYDGQGLVVTANPVLREGTITVKEMNEMMNKLPSFKCGEMSIDVRIKSILGSNIKSEFTQYSNPINLKLTAYSTQQPILSFVKDGNTPSTEPKLLSTGYISNSDYEAYLFLQAGNYKFVRPDACGSFTSPTILGGTGSLANGTIDVSATPASINIANTGQYLVKANLTANTYSINEFTSIGVFGRATRAGAFGFSNTVPMIYDATSKKWSLTMDLLKGQVLKFKSIKWTGPLIIPPTSAAFPKPDYVPTSSTTLSILGSVTPNILTENSTAGADIKIPGTASLTETQKYLLTVDVSNPRNYTYTITPK